MAHQELLEQYKQIEDIRKLRSQHIMDWLRIGFPVGGALFGFFSFLGRDGDLLLTLLGWFLFISPMIIWRVVVHHIDTQIIQLYPLMIELDKKLEWATNTSYIFNNLSKNSKRYLERRLEVNTGWLNNQDYRQYVNRSIELKKNPYRLLLDAWDEHPGHSYVGFRGHLEQHIAVAIICIIAFIIAIIIGT